MELKRKEEVVKNLVNTVANLENSLGDDKQLSRKISKRMSIVEKPVKKPVASHRKKKSLVEKKDSSCGAQQKGISNY